MPKNNNIVTKSKDLRGVSSHVAIGSSVAAGLTRYVTFLRVEQDVTLMNEGSKVYFCSTAASNTAANTATASTAQKMVVVLQSALQAQKEYQSGIKIDAENPLFTIAESKFFSAYLCSVAGQSAPVNIFAQYYDQ